MLGQTLYNMYLRHLARFGGSAKAWEELWPEERDTWRSLAAELQLK